MSDSRRRTISTKVVHVVAVGNDLAAQGRSIDISGIRAGLTERGLYREERGNQALGDILGAWGLGLPSEMQTFLWFVHPSEPCPPGWRRVSYARRDDGWLPHVRNIRVYIWPAGGVDRAFLELKFVIPSDWDWSKYDLI